MSAASSKEAKLEDIKAVLKSIIIPYKEGATIYQIQNDYKELEGNSLPSADFGYHSSRDFLKSMGDILVSQTNNYGESIFRAKFGEDTSHIQALVLGQKTVSRKRKKRPVYSSHSGIRYNNYNNLRPSSWGTFNWTGGGSSSGLRNRAIVPAGFGDRPNPGVSSQNTVPKPRTQMIPRSALRPVVKPNHFQSPQVNSHTSQKVGLASNRRLPGPANYTRASAPCLDAMDIKNIRDLLKIYGSDGISMGLFNAVYEKTFGSPLSPHARGFSDLQHALSTINHICKVELHPSNKYYVIKLVDLPNIQNGTTNGISPKKTPERSPKSSPKKTPVRASQSNGQLGPGANNRDNPHRKVVSVSDNPYEMRVEVQNGVDDREALENFPNTAIQYFKNILEKHPFGISAEMFLSEYEALCGAAMEPTQWGFFALIEVFYALPSLFFVDPADAQVGSNNDNIIYDAKKVPPEVRARVVEYHNSSYQSIENEAQLRWSFKLKVMALLMKAPDGISVDNFSTDYYLNFKESLDPTHFHFKDFTEMFKTLSEELPIQLTKSYSGDDLSVSLVDDWQSKWIDICVENNQYDALKTMIVTEGVVLPGDNIPDVDVDPATIDQDVWHPIILTSVINPNCMFVNLFGKYYSEALDTIMNKMSIYSSPSCSGLEVPSYCLKENYFCVAPFDVNNHWHRVKIVKVEPGKKKVKIAFIDFGGEQLIESSKLRLMKKEFSYLPAQAIRISLKGIRPKTDRWPSNAKNEILAFMNRGLNKDDTLNKDGHILCRLHTRRSPFAKETVRYEAQICAPIPFGYVFLHKQLIESGLAMIEEVATIPKNRNEVVIPNNDVHRPLRKQTRIAAKKMIATLKNLQSRDTMVRADEESTHPDRDNQSQAPQMNGDTPRTNGSADHSKCPGQSGSENLEHRLYNLNL